MIRIAFLAVRGPKTRYVLNFGVPVGPGPPEPRKLIFHEGDMEETKRRIGIPKNKDFGIPTEPNGKSGGKLRAPP